MTIGAGAPIYYDHANMLVACNNPNSIHTQNTQLAAYFRRYLLQKAISVFDWTLPDNWNRDFFLYVLYCWGVVAVIKTDKFGVIPQGCGLTGYNVQYQPTNAIITNPLLRGILSPIIGKQCEIIKLQPDYGGIMDMVNSTAEDMALASEALSMNLINSKLSYVFAASGKSVAESFKQMYDKIMSGKPAVFMDKDLFTEEGKPLWQAWTQDLRSTFIAPEIMDTLHEIEARFNQQVGIPSANTDKKERLVVDEVNANNTDTFCKAALWLEELQQCCERVNTMFYGGEKKVAVTWRNIPQNGGADDGTRNDQYSGSL